MLKWFSKPTLRQQLEQELVNLQAGRVEATAKAALWKATERFRLNEIGRVEAELAELTGAACTAQAVVEQPAPFLLAAAADPARRH